MTQNNLGTALEILGERESERARLEEAVDRLDGEIAKPPPEIEFFSALVDREVLVRLLYIELFQWFGGSRPRFDDGF